MKSLMENMDKMDKKEKAKLILVPTPLDEEAKFPHETLELFKEVLATSPKALFVVEEIKIGRRRWLNSGLPREYVEKLVELNEHNTKEQTAILLNAMKKEGQDVYLMSDGGLPAFCDPGRELVEACHRQGVKVTALPFANSIALSIALSGFLHDKWMFEGFLPKDKKERDLRLAQILKNPWTAVVMDTPYRLCSLLEEFSQTKTDREFCLVMDLSLESEEIIRGSLKKILGLVKAKSKREFVLVVGNKN